MDSFLSHGVFCEKRIRISSSARPKNPLSDWPICSATFSRGVVAAPDNTSKHCAPQRHYAGNIRPRKKWGLRLQANTTATMAADKRGDFRKAVDLIEHSAVWACVLG
jgi:hypothetical protein